MADFEEFKKRITDFKTKITDEQLKESEIRNKYPYIYNSWRGFKFTEKVLINMLVNHNVKVISVDNNNNTFVCNDGNEYPLLDGENDISKEELQIQIDKAKIIMKNIIDNGETDNP